MNDMRKDMERARDESGTDGATLAPNEVKVIRIDSKLDGLRERSKGGETDWRSATNRAENVAVMDMDRFKVKRIHYSLVES